MACGRVPARRKPAPPPGNQRGRNVASQRSVGGDRDGAMKRRGVTTALLVLPVVVLPIVIWQTQKDKIPGMDAHGKMVVNWMISAAIYSVASILLMLVLIGFLTFLAVIVMGIVFPIVGAIKANNGELWEYPLTIKLIK